MRPRLWLARGRRLLRRGASARVLLLAAALLAAALLLRAALPRAAPPAPAAAAEPAAQARAAACVAWRATRCGSVLRERVPTEDLPCYATIRPRDKHMSGATSFCRPDEYICTSDVARAGAGFCECAGQRVPSIAVARACGETALIWHLRRAAARSFTCAAECARSAASASPPLALEPPACARGGAGHAKGPRVHAPPPLAAADVAAVRALWRRVDAAFQASGGLDVVLPPGQRGVGAAPGNDFVAAGLRMPAADVARASRQWRAFVASAPAFPAPLFAGRGVVIGGGGLGYAVPAWVALHALRAANCTLPVEVWFPAHEAPAPGSGLEAAMRRLGAAVRSTDDILPGGASSRVLSRYTFKAAALIFSRFEEVLWLDADNVALRDPEAAGVFDGEAYRRSGLLLWRDHWAPSAAPDAAAVLGIAGVPMPPWTCESGQLALHKRTAWQPALLALFLNLQGPLYYRLLSSYMGAGDKETWPAAAAALRRPAAWVAAPPGAAGVPWPDTEHAQEVRSNAMLQHAPAEGGGELLFVHSNYFKWDLADMPIRKTHDAAMQIGGGGSGDGDEDEPPRRWLLMTPPGWDAEEAAAAEAAGARTAWLPAPPALRAAAGGADPEAAAWRAVRALRCAPWFDSYAAERRLRHGEIMAERIRGEPRPFKGVVLAEHAGGRFRPRRRGWLPWQ